MSTAKGLVGFSAAAASFERFDGGSPQAEIHLRVRWCDTTGRARAQREGNVYIEDVTGDIDAAVDKGTILLRLPEQGQYDIDAGSKWGSVTSDFSGQGRKGLVASGASVRRTCPGSDS